MLLIVSPEADKKSVKKHNKQTNIAVPGFQKGDFVLVRIPQNKGHKIQFMWKGPKQIHDISHNLICEIEDLLTGSKEFVHARRLTMYKPGMDGKEIDPQLVSHLEYANTQFTQLKV